MRVCTCCFEPEVADDNPTGAMLENCVIVPDDTPIAGMHATDASFISPDVLVKAGLNWDGSAWRMSNGGIISGSYNVTLVSESMEWTGWEERGANCPRCGSGDWEEDTYSDEITAPGVVLGQLHCKNCGYKGSSYIY